MPGVSGQGLLLAFIAAATTLVGPVTAELISSVKSDGTQSCWSQPAGDFFLFISGPGQYKSGVLHNVYSALLRVQEVFASLKTSLGGTIMAHEWLAHLHKSSIFRDGSTSAWFERIKAEPNIMTLSYWVDEFDVVLKRVKSDKSAGELTAWLSLWNVGGMLVKNTGVINAHIHHVFSSVFACSQHQAAYDLGVDEDNSGRGFSPRFIFTVGHVEKRMWAFAKDVSISLWTRVHAHTSLLAVRPSPSRRVDDLLRRMMRLRRSITPRCS